MKIISFIIAAYNSEKYIQETFDSIYDTENKKYESLFEIILINDGSTDKTLSLIDEYIQNKNIKNIVIISQINKGLSIARNIGIQRANGKYITFLDSDDLISNDYFPKIIPLLKTNKFDIIEFGFSQFTKNNNLNIKQKRLYNLSGSYYINDIKEFVFAKTNWYACTRVIRKSIMVKFKFIENIYYEDSLTIPKIYNFENYLIYFLNCPLLYYRKHNGSITSFHTMKHYNDLKFILSNFESEEDHIKLLKIRYLRTLNYFEHELNLNLTITKRNDNYINFIDKRKITRLLFKDLIFYIFPSIYNHLLKLKLKLKK